MRIFLSVLILIFSLQSWIKADDIRDFEIEGISLEDSALKYFTEEKIKSNSKNFFRNKKYTPVNNDKLSFFEIYDYFDFRFLTGDKNYIMHCIAGIVNFDNKNLAISNLKSVDLIISVKKIDSLKKEVGKQSAMEDKFNQDIEELSQETENLVSEIEKWQT